MRYLTLLLLVTVALCGINAAKKIQTPTKAFKAIVKAADKGGGIIQLTSSSFQRYAEAANRNYTFVVQLQSLDPRYRCENCRAAADEFKLLSDAYLKRINYDYHSKEFLKTPIFFAQFEYSERSIEHFKKFQISNIPHFAVVRPSTKAELTCGARDQSSTAFGAEMMSKMIAKVTKIRLKVSRPITPMLMYYGSMIIGGYLFFFQLAPGVYSNFFTPVLPFILAIGVYAFVMAGTIYNLIRTPQWFDMNPYTGAPQYIMPSGRAQYVFEGMIVAALMVTIGLLHVGINFNADKNRPAWKQRLYFYGMIVFYVFTLNVLAQLFYVKYAFYPYKFKLFDVIKKGQ